jgi:hypothetical protein
MWLTLFACSGSKPTVDDPPVDPDDPTVVDSGSDPDPEPDPGEHTGTTGEHTGTPTSSTVWSPPLGTTWQWQLSGNADLTLPVEVYDLDLFDTPQRDLDTLHADGKHVICYFSAGSIENWRSDADQFPEVAIGRALEGWAGERWLDVRDPTVRTVLAARLDLAVDKACDAVEPDNVDGYENNTGFDLDRADQLDFLRFLSTEAHARGLSVGLKNSVGLVAELHPDFDWALNEECFAYDECDRLDPFRTDGKAIFHVEYVNRESQAAALRDQVCSDPAVSGFSTLVKTWDLDDFVLTCP